MIKLFIEVFRELVGQENIHIEQRIYIYLLYMVIAIFIAL